MPTVASRPSPSLSVDPATTVVLPRDSNQALGIGRFAVDFMGQKFGKPSQAVLDRTRLFHADSVLCGLSALALRTNAPTLLRNEALEVPQTSRRAPVFGSKTLVAPEKAIAANSAAVREWDSNGTNFGYNPKLDHSAGEFGHNDFCPVAVAAAQIAGRDGPFALRGMVLLDEIRGRLAEVFSLKSYKIDHVVHGAIASAATYALCWGPRPSRSNRPSACSWRITFRGGPSAPASNSATPRASAAISTEVAILSMQRAMRASSVPATSSAILRPSGDTSSPPPRERSDGSKWRPSPFDLVLSHSGDDFAVMGMHFKLGLYEHQSAGALQAVIDQIAATPDLLSDPSGAAIKSIRILAYEPAFGIIGNPAKMDPKTRQSADHSMAYIVATLLRKALESPRALGGRQGGTDDIWKA